MVHKIRAIPTIYNDVKYRSRLEAKWAAMFDLLSWKHSYEPLDFEGYIPDFIITSSNEHMFVEVKGAIDQKNLFGMCSKMRLFAKEKRRECIAVGAYMEEEPYLTIRGIMHGLTCGIRIHGGRHHTLFIKWCNVCEKYTLPFGYANKCFFCQSHTDELSEHLKLQLVKMWKNAANITQWHPKEEAYEYNHEEKNDMILMSCVYEMMLYPKHRAFSREFETEEKYKKFFNDFSNTEIKINSVLDNHFSDKNFVINILRLTPAQKSDDKYEQNAKDTYDAVGKHLLIRKLLAEMKFIHEKMENLEENDETYHHLVEQFKSAQKKYAELSRTI